MILPLVLLDSYGFQDMLREDWGPWAIMALGLIPFLIGIVEYKVGCIWMRWHLIYRAENPAGFWFFLGGKMIVSIFFIAYGLYGFFL